MPVEHEKIKCRYLYDPLSRLVGYAPVLDELLQRFYCKNRLVTEIQGQVRRSIVQQGEQLLAQQLRKDGKVETTLLGSDLQRSILQALKDE
ncbi:hypothetical protein PMI35_06107 [Pseudomonas sp. GM78]|uniref:hypothetical protein n=1 Tax=Pseudomonas sp. GM78 TaxID=1144337 RepID=UPI000270C1E2|nr:hypothetical protein PMI35_06107 [Pseudomonas sp. GM78]